MTQSIGAIESLPRVATIATHVGRIETFQKVLPVIAAQVNHVFVYLDGYATLPGFLASFRGVTVRRAEVEGNLHASSRLLCLRDLTAPTVVVVVDDDIIYPPDYVERLVAALQQVHGRAVVGVHGRIFLPPHESYVKDAAVLHFAQGLDRAWSVHEVGTGTSAFVSSVLDIDPRAWSRNDMDDVSIAIEAQRRGLWRIAVPRAPGWLTGHAQDQPDSLWRKTLADDTEQSRQMRILLSLYAQPLLKEDAVQAVSCKSEAIPDAGVKSATRAG